MVWIFPNVFTISSTGFFSQSGCMPLNFEGIFLTALAFLFHSGGWGVRRILTRTNLNQLMDQSFTDQNRIKQRETSTRDNCSFKGEKRLVSFTVKFQERQIRSTISILAQLFLRFGSILGQHGENFTSTNSCSQIIIHKMP